MSGPGLDALAGKTVVAGVVSGRDVSESERERLEHELRVIGEKDFAGYFVIVHDIVAFARSRRILCQGRGSAASTDLAREVARRRAG